MLLGSLQNRALAIDREKVLTRQHMHTLSNPKVHGKTVKESLETGIFTWHQQLPWYAPIWCL